MSQRSTPRYYQLRTILCQKIEQGDWRPHDALPSERELMLFYGVTHIIIRAALDLLEADGSMYGTHGRGTFVSPLKFEYSRNTLSSFHEDMQMRGMIPGQRLLFVGDLVPNPRV